MWATAAVRALFLHCQIGTWGTVHNPSREVVCRIAAALDGPVDEFEIAAGYIPKGKGPITASWRDDWRYSFIA